MIARVIRLALGIGLALVPLTGQAAVNVRSGEHAEFSRLVFAADSGQAWTVSRPRSDQVRIVFAESLPDLDLRNIFEFIPRTRLRAARADGDGIALDLGCACAVTVMQLPSGLVVIDIGDEQDEPEPDVAPVAVLRLPRLPLPLLPTVEPRRAPSGSSSDAPARRPVPPPQIRIQAIRDVPPVLRSRPEPSFAPDLRVCPHEAMARNILLADPAAALEALPAALADLLDDEDRLSLKALSRFAEVNLKIGFGSEAIHAEGGMEEPRASVLAIGSALDDVPRPASVELDPACGPATAILAILDADPVVGWERADLGLLREFLDLLPVARWRDIGPRLAARLAHLDAADLLTGLFPGLPADGETGIATDDRLSAGTDAAAIAAAERILSRQNEAGEPSEEIHLVNAVALSGSIPEGDFRTGFNRTLAEAFVLSNYPVEALRFVADGRVDPEVVFEVALDHLPPESAAEILVRLRPHLSDEARRDPRAANRFEALGLPDAAVRFAGRRTRALPEEVPDGPAGGDPWLSRDLTSLAAAPRPDWTARNAVAAAILERNATPAPEADLAAAGQALESSRNIRDLLDRLMAEDGSS